MPALYLHIPFCRRKCPYCDFFSVDADDDRLASYPELLLQHLELVHREGRWQGPFDTVFFGGGTPSLLAPAAVGRILETTANLFGFAPTAEISLEANPGTVSFESLSGYRAAGVNRLSLGIQSLDPEQLQRLGRIHTPEEGREAVHLARQAGFDDLGLDLIFALPGQTEATLEQELQNLLSLEPDHLSCYGLTVEDQTPFFHLHRRGDLELPDEETFARLFLLLHHRLTGAGFEHYEISNYARPGYACRHNLAYWERRPYLGLGPGAHSFLDRGWGERLAAKPDLDSYTASLARGENPSHRIERFEAATARGEALYLGLRTAAGVSDADFSARFDCRLEDVFPDALRALGPRLSRAEGRWRFDLEGWLIYDHLIQHFL